MLKQLIILLISLVTVINVIADDDAQAPFSSETRCLPAPVQPDSTWSYSGTLLMAGYAGIHAMQAGWETPRVEAFFSAGALGEPHEGGQLSPNGQWYAVPLGDSWVKPSFNQFWITNGLRIYSTSDETEISLDLRDYDYLLDYSREAYYGGTSWTYEAVRWIDDNSLIIGSFLVRPFGDEIEVEVAPIDVALIWYDFEAAPNWSRVYSYHDAAENNKGIFDPEHPNDLITSFQADGLAWKHDSSGFIADQQFNDSDSLSLFDKDGEFIERLFVDDDGLIEIRRPVSGRNDLAWSPDDSKFAFVYYTYSQDAALIILDLENKVAINTCLNPVSDPVWSPDGRQIAVLLRASENLKVVIINLETWRVYDVARHSGIWGSLSPDMIAWRNND